MTEASQEAAPTSEPKYRAIRALYDTDHVTVYQAYNDAIASAAVEHQKLSASASFRYTRMTWIKPSWCWMMYRCGYAEKDKGQERVLAITMRRTDLEELLRGAVVSEHTQKHTGKQGEKGEQEMKRSWRRGESVVVQWDPERGPRLERLGYRSIQIGIPPTLSQRWVEEMIVRIEDVTERAKDMKSVLDQDEKRKIGVAQLVESGLMPQEREMDVPGDVRKQLHMDQTDEGQI